MRAMRLNWKIRLKLRMKTNLIRKTKTKLKRFWKKLIRIISVSRIQTL
jgi:hypothetical protein